MLVLVPSIVVVKSVSDDITSPFKLQVIEMGSSPFITTQTSCAKLPWLTVSTPNENGTISGGSKTKIFSVPSLKKIITVDFKTCSVGNRTSWIRCSTCVNPNMLVINR